MMDDKNSKAIGLAVCGGIAAYKAAELASLLVKQGYCVYPIMTPSATDFLGPLTLEALTGNKVFISYQDAREPGGMDHIHLAKLLDLLVIAPLTANTASKLAHGMADHFLGAAYLAYRGPTLACPAMNTAMLEHPASVRNLNILENDGVQMCMGESGLLACGDVGMGRMAEPKVIVEFIQQILSPKIPELFGKKVLINTGPTIEDIDPVRFLSNRSTGKMGFALAKAFKNAGADVTCVHGPVHVEPPTGVELIAVRSAGQMAEQCLAIAHQADIVVLTAAVADFSPRQSEQKIKKNSFDGQLKLEPTIDILKTIGARKKSSQIVAGFAAETQNVEAHAKLKLKQKNIDLIFSNDVSDRRFGFASDENTIVAFTRNGATIQFPPEKKESLAIDMVHFICEEFL